MSMEPRYIASNLLNLDIIYHWAPPSYALTSSYALNVSLHIYSDVHRQHTFLRENKNMVSCVVDFI